MLTDKEFRRLSRAELIEVIYRMQQDEQELRRENDELKARLADRRSHLSEAGSIAQAALALNGVFAAAQSAADDYLAEIAELRDKLAAQVAQTAQTVQGAQHFQASEAPGQNAADVPSPSEKGAVG